MALHKGPVLALKLLDESGGAPLGLVPADADAPGALLALAGAPPASLAPPALPYGPAPAGAA